MSKSHTKKADPRAGLRLVPGLGLVDLARAGLPEGLQDKLEGELALFAERMHEGLMAAALAVGLEVFADLLDANVTELAGPKGRHNPHRAAVRHGTEAAKVPMGGRMIDVRRPRVRSADGTTEVPLEAWAALSSRDLLDGHTVASMLCGVSTRNYASTLEPAGATLSEASSSTSHSAVSRRFVAATRDGLAAFRSRPLDDRRFVVMFIDGFDLAGETMVGALGVDDTGAKMPLSVVQGSTENKAVCTRLLNSLEERGFDATGGVLFVIDGGKGIASAITAKYGDRNLSRGGCRVLSGFRLDGGLVDPCFAGWGGGDGRLVAEAVGVRGVGGVEDGLACCDDRSGGAGVDVAGVEVAQR
jgi:transposase-like protein